MNFIPPPKPIEACAVQNCEARAACARPETGDVQVHPQLIGEWCQDRVERVQPRTMRSTATDRFKFRRAIG